MTQTETQQDGRWLGTREAAEFLGVKWDTFRHSYYAWGVPSYKIGGRRMFTRADLNEWVQARKDSAA